MGKRSILWCVFLLWISGCALASNAERKEYADRVKAAFVKGWGAYMNYAYGMDAVNPIAKRGHNWYEETLLMTPVDAYSTMCLMGLEKEKTEARMM